MKKQRTEREWTIIAVECETAYLLAPWYSPMRLFFFLGKKYARRKAELIGEANEK
jgi:hypothetical protein|tara:strand:+ start:587 stop:751 length:165 start_codon:yes stop_codon:yes gene_type:complete